MNKKFNGKKKGRKFARAIEDEILSQNRREERKEPSGKRDIVKMRHTRGFPLWDAKREIRPMPGADVTVVQVLDGAHLHAGTGANFYSSSTIANSNPVFNFTVADLPQFSTFSAMYDQYRFEKIKLCFVSAQSENTNTTGGSAPINNPLHLVVDFDDSTALASEDAALQYDHIITLAQYQSAEITFVPSVTPAFYGGVAFTGFGVAKSTEGWMDVASSGNYHYGVKAYQILTNTVCSWLIYLTYTVSWKNLR